jgi:uncharacterized repeat protein (TIGR02543 family)
VLNNNNPNIGTSTAEICVVFDNGNKGYDLTVGDTNGKIQGNIVSVFGGSGSINVTGNHNGYHYEYISANTEIAEIDQYTGVIIPKKEGDVDISAVLKNDNTVVSNTYTYTLHVFAPNEGLDWNRVKTYSYNYTNADNKFLWVIKNYYSNTPKPSYDWTPTTLLKTATYIRQNASGSDNNSWKQIASFTTPNLDYYRAICQKIELNVRVPKYSKATATYRLAGNVTLGSGNYNAHYGFEIKDLGVVSSEVADDEILTISLNTADGDNATSTPITLTTLKRKGVNQGHYDFMGAASEAPKWEVNNSDKGSATSEIRYLAVMAYLTRVYPYNSNSTYSADASFGYKGIPTYTYYSHVYYCMNYGENVGKFYKDEELYSKGKTETMQMNSNFGAPTRKGYTFLGWSTNPEATVAEYAYQGEFCSYDDVNGGGKGRVDLYAVWRPIPYIVTLSPNGGSGKTEEIVAYYGLLMPEDESIVAPTRKGYDFNGYRTQKDITPRVFYYDANMKSLRNYDQARNYTLYADWTAHTTKITFDFQGGAYGASEVTATYGEDMPNAWAPQRDGYTFAGYYRNANGGGTQYYNANMTSSSTWNVDEPEVTLYAKWTANTYTVTLDKQGGTGGSSSTTATYGQPLSSGLTAPTKDGYEFKGYYSNENQEYAESTGQDYGGKQYYDKNMNGVEPWDKTEGGTIYAHWAPKTYIVTFDLGDESHAAIFPDNVVSANKDRIMEITSDGKMKVSFDYGISGDNSIDLSVPKKPGYEMLGWYDANGDLIVTVDIKDRHAYITDKNNYWQKDGNNVKWNYADDLVLTAKFRCKYTVEDAGNGPIIKFDNEIVEPDQDWLSSVISDLQGAAKEVGTPENPVMAFDLRTSKNIWTGNKFARLNVMESLQSEEYKDYISPNVLVYFNDNESEAWYIDGTKPEYQGRNDADCYNAVSLDNKCRNLVVTDRYRIKIPYAFNASKASYARDANVASGDAAKDQAKNSTWGTLCLPYPIQNNTNGVKFYELQSTANNYMEFEEMTRDKVIPANTPVLYIRTDGGVSSMITIKEQNVGVPMNANYTAVNKSYSNADESIRDWEFRGNLETTVFYGKGYVNPPAGAQILDGDVYYFKQDKFTYLNPKMEKNGKTYQAAKMTLYPYRAYFYRNTEGSYYSSAKVSEYSILVIGEDGATLDITNEIFGDGEGDGKIYDLNGIRVMKPVKGRLYIVNGQKKVYK